MNPHTYHSDFFISYASEDYNFASNLEKALLSKGVKAWFDQKNMQLGDSIYEGINQGILNSRYGLILLSHSYLQKPWTIHELKSLDAREKEERRKVIIPLRYKISHFEVIRKWPLLADKLSIDADTFLQRLIDKNKVSNGDIISLLENSRNHNDPTNKTADAINPIEAIIEPLYKRSISELTRSSIIEIFDKIEDMEKYKPENLLNSLWLILFTEIEDNHIQIPKRFTDQIQTRIKKVNPVQKENLMLLSKIKLYSSRAQKLTHLPH